MDFISRILIAAVLILIGVTSAAGAEKEEDIPLNKVPQKVLEASQE